MNSEMERAHPFLFRSDDGLDRIVRGGYEARLLAEGRSVDVIWQHIPEKITFYLDSAQEWPGFEVIYLLEGTLRYVDADPPVRLTPGDYIARHLVSERIYFETETEVRLLSVSSPPAFASMREETEEFHEIARRVEADEYLDGHSRRLERMAAMTGEKLGLSGEQMGHLSYAAFFHDIGKAKVPREILKKPGRLTEAEWETMKQHSRWGREMLAESDLPPEVAEIVEQIHERVDGGGYPRGLAGDEIRLEAKIIAVVDAYDAMTTDRPYRGALAPEGARQRLVENAGSQFDERVVNAFLEVLEEDAAFAERQRSSQYGEELARLRQREAFVRIGEEILAGKDLEEILHHIVTAITRHAPFRRAALALYDRAISPQSVDEVHIVQVACAGLTAEEEERLRGNPLPPEERKAIFHDDYRLSRCYYIPHDRAPWGDRPGLVKGQVAPHEGGDWHPDDFLFIPLWVEEGRLVGLISVDEPTDGRRPTPESLEPVEMFANLAALAIEQARHLRQLDEFQRRLRGIYRLSEYLSRLDDLDTLMDRAVEIIRENFDYDHVDLLLAEGDKLAVRSFDTKLPPEEMLWENFERLGMGRGITGWVARHRRPAFAGDVRRDPRYISGHPAIRSELAVPVLDEDELLGVLNIESVRPHAFTRDDRELLGELARQLGVAIRSVSRRCELQELATHDPLTGAYNRHYFSELVKGEQARLRRAGGPISLLLIDFEDFYEVNDRFGHLEGDRVLKEAAALFQGSVRAVDSVIRYGGDEFLIVMPGTSRTEAERAAQQLRRRVEEEDFGLSYPIAIRTGVATWDPQCGKNFEEILDEADTWMYRRRGRRKKARRRRE